MNNKHVGFCLLFLQATVMCMHQRNTGAQLEVPQYRTNPRRLSEGKVPTQPILTSSGEIRMRQSPKSPNQAISPGDYFRWTPGSPIPTGNVSSK